MVEFLSAHTAKIRACREKISTIIENERERGCKTSAIEEVVEPLLQHFRELMEAALVKPVESEEDFRTIMPPIENTYLEWKTLKNQFEETLRLAYLGNIPQSNLVLDSIYDYIEKNMGVPLSAAYADLQDKWRKHLESYPWDAFLSGVGRHLESDAFEDCMKALTHGDEFDLEDAAENLTGAFRHLFIKFLEEKKGRDKDIITAEHQLWERPEIILANDYWQSRHRRRILDLLLEKSEAPTGGFAVVKSFFSPPPGIPSARQYIISQLKDSKALDREKFLRCLVLHPDQEIRRYAARNVEPLGFWKALTPKAVPCASILSLLERVVGSEKFDDNFRKIFFNSVYKRLFSLTTRSDVLYARGIVRIFTRLDFFLEDEYFVKLMRLMKYLESKERLFNIKDTLLDEHISKLRKSKEHAGTRRSEDPDFTGIPPVILRKLAAEGHFWLELAKHPIFKIAKETIPHINTQDRALRIATQKHVNQEVLRAVGKRRDLFSTRTNRLALLSNPRTPPTISMDYVSDMDKKDIEVLLRTSSLHPEFRRFLQQRLR